MSNEENDDKPKQASRKKQFFDRDAQGLSKTLRQWIDQAPRPDLTEDEYLAEIMDRTPVTIFRAIAALKATTGNARRLKACEKAIEDLLGYIERRAETGRPETIYDIAAIDALRNHVIPTQSKPGTKPKHPEDAVSENFRWIHMLAEYRELRKAEPKVSSEQISDAIFEQFYEDPHSESFDASNISEKNIIY